MKKRLFIAYLFILVLVSCNSGKCDLEGCSQKGEGWENYKDNPSCSAWGACKIKNSGGYCSKEHALKGLSQ